MPTITGVYLEDYDMHSCRTERTVSHSEPRLKLRKWRRAFGRVNEGSCEVPLCGTYGRMLSFPDDS